MLWLPTAGQEEETPFPEVIMPVGIEFIQLPYDSLKALLPPVAKTDSFIQYTHNIIETYAFDNDDTAYLFEVENEVRLVIRNEAGWLITKDRIDYKGMNYGYILEFVSLDKKGHKEILVKSSCSFYKGGRYGNIDSDYGDYLLISSDRQEVLYTGYVYREEGRWYSGPTMEDGINEDTEIEEMENNQYWHYGRSASYYDIVVKDASLIADNMDFTVDENHPEYASLDTLQAVVYAWQDDKLVKQGTVPQFKNLAGGYRMLQGKAGSGYVTMHLTDFGNGYEGYYYVDDTGSTIQLTGTRGQNDSLVLEEPDGKAYFKGSMNDSVFSGVWHAENMETEFRLADYNGLGTVPLKPFHFLDSFISENGSKYIADMQFYITDTPFASNRPGFMVSHMLYSGDKYFRPVDVFNEFRNNVYDAVEDADNAGPQCKYYYQQIREAYNNKNIISFDCLLYEYDDFGRYTPECKLLTYDSRWNTSLEWGTIFSVSGNDSVFRNIIHKTGQQIGIKINETHYINDWLIEHGGLVFKLSGSSEEKVYVPKRMIEPYIRDAYQDRF